MKKIKPAKIIVMLLIFSIAVSCFVSCGEKDQGGTDETSTANNSTNETAEGETVNPRFAVKENLPDHLDFEDSTFRILYPTWSMYSDYYFAETEIGEQLNDSIYQRTLNVEEKLNVKIEPVTLGGIDSIYSAVEKTVKTGTDEYSLVLTHCITGVTSFTTSGIAANWNEVPYVDFSKPWWNQKMNDLLSVQGVLVPAVSDFIIFDPNVIYFNKRIIKDFSLEDPYALVKSGEWTWDKFNEMARVVSKDLDGDGAFTKNDQYGFVTHVGWMLDSALQSSGMYIVQKGQDDFPEVMLNNEKFGQILQKLYTIVYENNTTFVSSWDPNYSTGTFESEVPMSSDRVLFHIDPLSVGKRYRTYEVDFGILPFPKFDEHQKEYLSLSWNGFMVVPQTADMEMVGAVTEMLAAESHRYVIPAYYDVLLTSKISRDEESVEMIDIIYKGACYDFGMVYGNWEGLSFPISSILGNKTAAYVSTMEKSGPSFQRNFDKLYNKIMQNYIDG